jgi:predicted ATPase/DNA-binding XRE family transcriptional regulator
VTGVTPSFGDLLREYRLRAGLSQSGLAEKANVSEDAVGALERGVRKAPHRATVVLFAKALALNANDSAALESARLAARKTSSSRIGHNIPSSRTSFVGRETDVAQVRKLLDRSRLVTITGSGGVGKTRLSLEAGRHLLGGRWDEVWFVDLTALVDGESIAAKIASTIEPRLTEHADSMAVLAVALQRRRMLLILDNCEHLIVRAAEASDSILERCPHVSVLATSREPLNISGEFVFRLSSLSAEAASDLFVQRALAADHDMSFDADQLPVIAEIADRLGGIPLSIELIAAQVHIVGLEMLRSRLQDELRVPSGRRDLPARQQTVVAAIEWSYRLLSDAEQRLLTDVSIFSGGFALSAAERVCGVDAGGRSQVLPLLISLTNKSLIQVANENGNKRYSLLESVRSFCQDALRNANRFDQVARHHARWLAEIAEEIEHRHEYAEADRLNDLLQELDNARTAVAWSLDAADEDDRVLGAQILSALGELWSRVGRTGEHARLIDVALARIDEARHTQAVAYLLAEQVARAWQRPNVLDSIERALDVAERSGDVRIQAKLLLVAANVLSMHRELEKSEAYLERASDLLLTRDMGGSMLFASMLFARSRLRMRQGRIDEARCDVKRSEENALALGAGSYIVCLAHMLRSDIEYAVGNTRLALEYIERILENDFASDVGIAKLAREREINLLLQSDNVEHAIEPLRDLLNSMRKTEDFTRGELEYAALALALRKNPLGAARLLGRVRSLESATPFIRLQQRQDANDLLWSLLRRQLDDEALTAALADGAKLAGDEAVDEALAALESN